MPELAEQLPGKVQELIASTVLEYVVEVVYCKTVGMLLLPVRLAVATLVVAACGAVVQTVETGVECQAVYVIE